MSSCLMNFLQSALPPIAAFVLAYYVARPLLKLILNHFIFARLSSIRKKLKRCGDWAVITGATDGIGKAYAQLLAKDGLNIVLVSRSQEKLDDTAAELQASYKVQTKIIVADFAKTDIYDKIDAELGDLSIACLVNNVGIGNPHPNYFACDEDFDIDLYCNMINVNCLSMIRMTRIVVQRMQKADRGGAVINVASATGLEPMPLLSVYSATKAFAVFFSRAIEIELSSSKSGKKKIIVQTVTPYFVATKLSKIRRASYFAPSPKSYVNEALNLLGVESFTLGCFSHALQRFFMDLAPTPVLKMITVKTLEATRRAAIKRAKNKNN